MSVDLRVSEDVLDAIGEDQFEAHLKLFDATVVGKTGPDKYGPEPFTVVYHLDIPGAPEDATEVVPIYQNVTENGSTTVRLLSLEWLDGNRRRIPERPHAR